MPLPEKDVFTLGEIIDRWQFAGCDMVTLRDYARHDRLVFAVYLRDLGSHERVVEESEDARVTRRVTTALLIEKPRRIDHPIRYLRSEDARRVLEAQPGERVAVSILYSSVDRTHESSTGYAQAHYLTPQDLLVTRAERDRFEAMNNVNRLSIRIRRLWHWMWRPENQAVTKAVAGGCAALALAAWTIVTFVLRRP